MSQSSLPTENELRAHLAQEYEGVFTDAMLEGFVDEYVNFGLAGPQVEEVLWHYPGAARILDVGCGYGAFVLVARREGLDAVGIELAPYELHYARARLGIERPDDDPGEVYVEGDGGALPFESASFDVVTLWNVLEHVQDDRAVLAESLRVLRPGGALFLVAPNYCSFRREAHYHVPWFPMLPRRLATRYLARLGRNPSFFEHQVHYRTNLGVQRLLRRLGAGIVDPRAAKLARPERLRGGRSAAVTRLRRLGLGPLVGLVLRLSFANPFRRAVQLVAVKPE